MSEPVGKVTVITAALLAVLTIRLGPADGDPTKQVPASADWLTLQKLNPTSSSAAALMPMPLRDKDNGNPEKLLWSDELARAFREAGIQFWSAHQDDPRRYLWLADTLYLPVKYWRARRDSTNTVIGLERDDNSSREWKTMHSALVAEMRSDPKADRATLARVELNSLVHDVLEEGFPPRKSLEWEDVLARTRQLCDHSETDLSSSQIVWRLSPLVLRAAADDGQAERDFLEVFRKSNRPELRRYAMARLRVTAMRTEMPRVQITPAGESPVNLKQYAGKVVLFDFWSNGCTACIEAMPRLQQVYAKYRASGFEIIGIYVRLYPPGAEVTEDERSIAWRHLERQGAKWRNVVFSGQEAKAFIENYYINGQPVTWLFGRDGRLVTTSTDNLETHVVDALARP